MRLGSPSTLDQKKLLLILLATLTIYFIFGPQALAISITAFVIKKIHDTRQIARLVQQAIEGNEVQALRQLRARQINLSDAQMLEMLLNAYSSNNRTIIQQLEQQDFKLKFDTILKIYFQKNDINLLKLLAKKFLYRQSLFQSQNLTSLLSNLINEEYNKGKPIILPVYLREYCGGSHIATVGFMKVGLGQHLVVEADRGLGRHDFSIFQRRSFSYHEFCKYTKTGHSPIYSTQWKTHKTKTFFSNNITAQKDNFCPSISA